MRVAGDERACAPRAARDQLRCDSALLQPFGPEGSDRRATPAPPGRRPAIGVVVNRRAEMRFRCEGRLAKPAAGGESSPGAEPAGHGAVSA